MAEKGDPRVLQHVARALRLRTGMTEKEFGMACRKIRGQERFLLGKDAVRTQAERELPNLRTAIWTYRETQAILEQLEGELERARRYQRPLSVAVADLDHFKKINDRHGHLAGDTLLRHISQVIAGGLRSTDRVGRYGGEEFLLVLPETDLQQAGKLVDRIRILVERAATPLEDGAVVHATVSIGVASLDDVAKEGSGSARDLIAAADRSLYCAKDLGRNRVHPEVSDFEELACLA